MCSARGLGSDYGGLGTDRDGKPITGGMLLLLLDCKHFGVVPAEIGGDGEVQMGDFGQEV